MGDPRFRKTVILLAEASDEGALGFVINRTTPYTFGDLASDIGFDLAPEVTDESVHYGGPVSPERGWILFRENPDAATERENVLTVSSDIHLAATLEVLGEFVTARTQSPFKLLLGYAGWAPQQLEDEIMAGAWLPLALDPDLLFGDGDDDIWDTALNQLGLTPGSFMMGGGGEA